MSERTPSDALKRAASDWRDWLMSCSLPLWWQGARINNGSFAEGLALDGGPLETRQSRVRVQGRQLFCFSLATRLGWSQPDLMSALRTSTKRFAVQCLRPDDVVGHMINIDTGDLVDDSVDLYDAAFFLLGLAEATAVLGHDATRASIDRFFSGLDAHIAYDATRGYREFLPTRDTRLQNPHMHLFEALLRLYDVTGELDVLSRAEALLEFVKEMFFDNDNRRVIETVTACDTDDSFEPGHSMEWVWLLGYHARLTSRQLDPFAVDLYERIEALDFKPGMMPLGVHIDGAITDPRRRLWAQTETIKAHLTMAEHHSDRSLYEQRAAETATAVQKLWRDRCAVDGGWFEHVDADGSITSTFMPASSGYHIYFAISELMRVTGLWQTHPTR